jgi:hypothetical protein
VYGAQRRIKITKRLEELFNLPEAMPDEPTQETAVEITEEQQTVFKDIDKIDLALPGVRGLDASDVEMDELATLAKDKFNDLMDLGMNVDSRFSGQIFQTAGVLLGHAITAKQSKLDKKLRMVDLQLKKMRLDHQVRQDTGDAGNSVEGEGTVLDRNALLAQILKKPE